MMSGLIGLTGCSTLFELTSNRRVSTPALLAFASKDPFDEDYRRFENSVSKLEWRTYNATTPCSEFFRSYDLGRLGYAKVFSDSETNPTWIVIETDYHCEQAAITKPDFDNIISRLSTMRWAR